MQEKQLAGAQVPTGPFTGFPAVAHVVEPLDRNDGVVTFASTEAVHICLCHPEISPVACPETKVCCDLENDVALVRLVGKRSATGRLSDRQSHPVSGVPCEKAGRAGHSRRQQHTIA
jgi:hypothetical protein